MTQPAKEILLMQVKAHESVLRRIASMRPEIDNLRSFLTRAMYADFELIRYTEGLIDKFNSTEAQIAGCLKTLKDTLDNGK